jgi:flagellin
MLISNLTSASGVQQQNIKKTDARLQAAIASLVSGKKTQDVAEIAVATQLQSQVVGLKQVSQSLAQAGSLTQVADGAIAQAQLINDRLQQIALQSQSPTTNSDQRKQLDQEFQALVKQLDQQVETTRFNGQNLLDGSLSGDNALSLNRLLADNGGEDNRLSVDNLATTTLFGGKKLDVLTADGAAKALEVLQSSGNRISSARASVGAFQQTLNYASASIDSAIINQQAAQSLLSDADFLSAVTESEQAKVQRNAQLSLAAQGNRLPAALLQLVS